MHEYDLTPDRPESPLRLQQLEYGSAKRSLLHNRLAVPDDIIVILRESQPRRFVRVGEVDEFVSLLRQTEFDPDGEELVRFAENHRLIHVPERADVISMDERDTHPSKTTVREESCPICSKPVGAGENAIGDAAYGVSQMLHVDCLDEFCEVLDSVWEAPENLLVDLI